MRIGFLGPAGTFTEEALRAEVPVDSNQLVPGNSIAEVLSAAQRGDTDKGIVAIENSIEGSVNTTLDMLAFEVDLLIEKEIIRPISHNLIGHEGTRAGELGRIISHPQATAQCRNYLSREYPKAKVEAANSTAEAVSMVAAQSQRDVAAIGTVLAAKLYGLQVLQRNIQDFEDNRTRFILVGREKVPRSGFDKTSIVCFIYEDRPGSLSEILQEFAARNINLTKIQSRPTRKALGDYCFFLDLEGHIEDEPVSAALDSLGSKLRHVKFLGSYPRAKT